MLYIVQATIVQNNNGWRLMSQLPSFLLDSEIQGIVDAKHAADIARSFIQRIDPDAEVSISVANWDKS
jgi:hypothetical protein